MEDSNVLERKLAAIMFSDMKGFSAKMGEDEETTFRLLSEHNKVMRETIQKYGGKVIKTIGDAFMSEFASPVNAVKCGYDVQEQFLRHNVDKTDDKKIILRIGIHMGDVLITENDIFGDGVNIAARLEPQAPPGGLCVSDTIYNFVKKQLKIQFEDGGKLALKNIKEPVQVYKVIPTLDEDAIKGPRQIYQYEIKEKLFDFPLGSVYRAEDTKLKRAVIIKHVNPLITANPEIKEKLLAEIRGSTEISHPNIISVLDYCDYNNNLYLVLEYIDGLEIDKWILTNKPKTLDIFTLTTQVADALTRLHQKGFHHLYLKADDIFISKTGWLKIFILGLTKYLPAEDRVKILSADERIIYRSPEQINGELGDQRSDVYSFGMIFYEFCSGKRPFEDGNLRLSAQKGSLPPIPSITVANAEVPEGLAGILMKCLSFKPGERYADMKQVLVDLRIQRQIFEGALAKDAERDARERMEKELEKEKLQKEFATKSPIEIIVSPDNLKVFLSINDARYFEEATSLDVIELALKKGIVQNLNRDKINDICEKGRPVENMLIAEGVPAKDGNNAQIEFKINIEAIKRLKLFKNDRIDLSTIAQWEFVRTDELIAKKILPEKGENGIDVFGKVIPAKSGKDYRFPVGEGLFVSDDTLSLYSEHNGMPYIDKQGKLNVLNLLVFDPSEMASIDPANIPQEDIVINNKITAKFELSVQRSIYVKGDILTDGDLHTSDGDIIVSGSIKGKDNENRFFMNAARKISAQKIEFAEIHAQGSVEVMNGIYNSNVDAKNGIRADEGALCCGYYFAENWVRAKVLGGKNNEETIIQIGSVDTLTSPEVEQLKQQIDELRKLIKKLQPQLDDYEKQRIRYERFKEVKKELYMSVLTKYKQVLANIERSKSEEIKRKQAIDFIQKKLYDKSLYEKKIYVAQTIYPGVQIKILDLEFTATEIYNKPQVIVRDKQIKVLHEKA